jgi:hypothetical protein
MSACEYEDMRPYCRVAPMGSHSGHLCGHSTTCDHHKMWARQVAGKYSKESLQKFRADDKVST